MKILLINSLYQPNVLGGAERIVQILAEMLLSYGHQPVVISTKQGPGTSYANVDGVKVYYVGIKNVYWAFKRQKNLRMLVPLWHAIDSYNPAMAAAVGEILDRERPDLVHTHNLRGLSVAVWHAIQKHGVPCVHTLHDYYLMCPRSTMLCDSVACSSSCFACSAYSLSRRHASNVPNGVIGVSDSVLQTHIGSGFFRHAVPTVIHNGIRSIGYTGRRHSPHLRCLRFGYLGALAPQKGIELLLEAIRTMPPNRFEMWIAGNGSPEYESKLVGKSKELPNVSYVGFVCAEDFLRQIDVLIVPSLWHEPLPTVVIEAFSMGVPVIASAMGGIPEMLQDGKTGFLFNPNQDGALKDAMLRFITHPSAIEEQSRQALCRARSFSAEHMLFRYLDFYRSIK